MGKRRIASDTLAIPMSSMIDVTFLLLIYFLVTRRDELPEAHLAVNLPSVNLQAVKADEKPNLLEIEVLPGRITLRKVPQTLPQLESMLAKLAAYDPEQTVIVKASLQAQTQELVQVLDLCKGLGLTKLNVMALK
jgi:biopolymer transport protein ExbD